LPIYRLARRASPAVKPEIRLEIGHVLFIDIIGYSKLLITEQTEQSARRAFTTARAAQEKVVEKQKDYAPALCLLGLIDAGLGNKQAALEEGRRATELLPVSKDAINGSVMSVYFAMIAAWTGEKDLAIEQLTAVVQPGLVAPLCTHYGFPKLMPFWDPLRGDPRFEQIVESLAPKEK
jgi:hypothetical protein